MSRAALKSLRFVTSGRSQVEFAPWGKHWWASRPGLTDTRQLMMVRVTMPPGAGHQFHRHPAREEIIYILEGRGEQWVDRERRQLRPGESAFIPRNTVHAIYNSSKRPVTFLAVLSPAKAPGPFLVDCYEDEPWCCLREPFRYVEVDPRTGRPRTGSPSWRSGCGRGTGRR
jgi:quercetin dioxygenase-like cupin family protein